MQVDRRSQQLGDNLRALFSLQSNRMILVQAQHGRRLCATDGIDERRNDVRKTLDAPILTASQQKSNSRTGAAHTRQVHMGRRTTLTSDGDAVAATAARDETVRPAGII